MSVSSLVASRRASEQVLHMAASSVTALIDSLQDGQMLHTFRRGRGLLSTGPCGLVPDPTGYNLFRVAAACASRNRPRPSLTSLHRGVAAVREVVVCVPPEPHGLGQRSPNACAECSEGTSDGPGPYGPLHHLKYVTAFIFVF